MTTTLARQETTPPWSSLPFEEEFAYFPASSRGGRLPKFERGPKREKASKGLLAPAPAPVEKPSRKPTFPSPGTKGRSIKPLVVIVLVVVVAITALLLNPGGSPENAPPAAVPAEQSLGQPAPVTFRYAFDPGSTRIYKMSMGLHLTPGEGGTAEAFDGKITSTMTTNVVRILPNGGAVLDVTIGDIRYDPPPPQGTAGPVKDSHMRLTVAPDGRVLYFEGTGGFLGNAGAVPTQILASRAQPSDELQSQFLFPRFSAGAVKPGDTWNVSSSFDLPFGNEGTVVAATGKLTGFQNSTYGRVANITYLVSSPLDFTMRMADLARMAEQQMVRGSDPVEVPPPLANASFKLAGNLAMNAHALVEQTSGELVKLDGTVKSKTKFTLDGAPAGASQPQSFNQTITLTIVRTH